MKISRLFLFASLALILVAGCKTNEPAPWEPEDPVPGCMDPTALSYNPDANEDDGSCTYPDTYFPMSAGNSWDLLGTVSIPVLGDFAFNGLFNMTKDTSINGVKYVVSEESVGNPDFGSQANRYAYRRANDGVVYRIDLGQDPLKETTFISYPVELNDTWYDTPEEDNFLCTIQSISNQSVTAGVFTDVIEILYTDLNNAQSFSVFFAKDIGIVKIAVAFEAPIIGELQIEPELVTYNLVGAQLK